MARKNKTLADDVKDFTDLSKEKMLGLARQSVQQAVNEMQTPVAKGGRMRVDTGFLRSSGMPGLNSYPSGPDDKAKDAVAGQYDWNVNSLTLVLSEMKLGDTFIFGWTAKYARTRDFYDGFVEAVAQRWNKIVSRNAEIIRDGQKK